MTESTCLHIQDRESGPIRVVELPWISVRIGRAAHCEVRLTEHELPDEVCRLQRRGQSWRLLPGRTRESHFARRPASGRLVPVAFRRSLSRRPSTVSPFARTGPPSPTGKCTPGPRRLDSMNPKSRRSKPRHWTLETDRLWRSRPEPPTSRLSPARTPGDRGRTADRATAAASRSSAADKIASPRERWDTRWKALGARSKPRGEQPAKPPRSSGRLTNPNLEPVPLREAAVPLIQPALPSSIRPAVAPVPTPGATKDRTGAGLAPTVEPDLARPEDRRDDAPTSSQQSLARPDRTPDADSIPTGPADGIDVEHHLAKRAARTPGSKTSLVSPVLTHEEPLHSASELSFVPNRLESIDPTLRPEIRATFGRSDQPLKPGG